MKKLAIVILSAFFVSILFSVHLCAKERAIKVKLRQSERVGAPVVAEVDLYSGSYALVIGIDKYTKGWPRLSGAVHDAELVAAVLKEKGFQVTFRKDLNSRELKQTFEKFFIFKGENPQARLFVWFAGHGHTLDGEGFLIPADAPRPGAGARFKYKALSMRRFGEFVRLAKSKHALAVFDSCFSGTIFDTQRTAPPPAVTRATTLPVRQFLSSGDSSQKVSDDGRFRKLFIRAIKGEERADANRDGYLTGSELGLFLTDRLTNLTESRQTPRYGKLRDEDWDRGDFVFQVASSGWGDYRPGTTTLSVKANVEGARVLVGGQYVGKTPLRDYKIKAGQHQIVVEKAGYETYRDTVDIDRGRMLSLRVMLKEAKTEQARLYVDTEPDGATVKILNIGPRFYQGIELEPGRYHVEVSANRHKTEKQWVDLAAGEDERLTVRLSPIRIATARHAGEVWREPVTGMEFVWVPGGCFEMGQTEAEKEYLIWEEGEEKYKMFNDELPRHRVCVDAFWMGKYEVIQGQWEKVMGGNPSYFKKGKNYPVEKVLWENCQSFIDRLNGKSGRQYKFRLPTEAEWEYACRGGGKPEIFAGGSNVDRVAWYTKNSGRRTHEVGNKAPNALGIHDMSGNVWEWCQDWWGKYDVGYEKNPTGPASGSKRVIRGGGWSFVAACIRCSFRYHYVPGLVIDSSIGFRLVRNP